MKKWIIFLLWATVSATVSATTYYVSPTGNDTFTGLDSANAWLSIDNGDQTGVLTPGDTVLIYPGTYTPTRSMHFTSSGTQLNPIVYKNLNRNEVILSAENNSGAVIIIDSNYVSISGVIIKNTTEEGVISNGNYVTLDHLTMYETGKEGIKFYSDSSLISHCKIYHANNIGLRIYGSYNMFYRNVIYSCNQEGIKNEDAGEFENLFYHNTVSSNGSHGIELKGNVKTARLFNNIVSINSGRGITGPVESICGFNNVWGNLSGNYSGLSDSAGGISSISLFVDISELKFALLEGSNNLDAGLDLGFEYNGTAPDIGAFEKYNTYYVSTTGDNQNDGSSELNAWLSIDNGDGHSLLAPGDTVRVLPGIYTDQVLVTDSGAASNDLITYKGIRDSVMIDGFDSLDSLVTILGEFIEWTEISIQNSSEDNLLIEGNNNIISYCQILSAGNDGIHTNGKTQFYHNVIADSYNFGIHQQVADSSLFVNNTFYYNWYGINCATDGNQIYNNIFLSNQGRAVSASSKNSLTYCILHDNNNDISGGGSFGFGTLFEDPLISNPDSGEFRLQSNSPAIDAGIDYGKSYYGKAPDMGAYESRPPVSIVISPVYDSLFADSLYDFEVIAIDSLGYPAYYGTLDWNHTFATGTIDSNGVFEPSLIGSGEVIVNSVEYDFYDTTNTMNVIAGTLESLAVTPDTATISTDSTLQFSVIGTDIHGNSTTNVGTITWSLTFNIGDIDSTGLLTPTKTGVTQVIANSSLGPEVFSDTIVITNGDVSYIQVTPDVSAIIEDSSAQFSAGGYDANSNFIKDLTDSVSWSTDDPGGNVTATGLYTAGPNPSPPDYYVKATYNTFSDSGTVSIVSDGALSFIQVEYLNGDVVSDTTTNTDNDTTTYYCRGYASDSSLLGDLTVQWIMLGNDSIGHFSDTIGTSSVLTLNKTGTGQIEAIFSSTIKDTSGVITCQAGDAAEFIINPDTYTVSTDSVLNFSAIANDADGNAVIPAIIPSWGVIGDIGTIDFTGAFDPTTVGIGQVVVSGAGIMDTSSDITVTVGALNHISITPDSIIISADSLQQFTATGYDADDNETSAGIISWSIPVSLGSFNGTGLFDPTLAGETRVIAQSNLGFVDTSTFIQIIPGNAVTLTVSPDSVNISADSSVNFTALAFDSDGNSTNTGSLEWGVVGSIGIISPTGLFSPLTSGTGQVYAQSSLGIIDTNSIVIVSSGSLDQLVIQYDTSIINLYDSIQFSVVGYDADFNTTDVGTLSWELLNGKGTITPTGMFTSTGHGYENIIVRSSLGDFADTSGIITIEALTASVIGDETEYVHPYTKAKSSMVFQLENSYLREKNINALTINDVSKGNGNLTELLSNIDSIGLYLDVDADLLITAADLLLDKQAYDVQNIDFTFAPVAIESGITRTFLTNLDLNLYASDGDSIRFCIEPSTDISVVDATPIVGADTLINTGYHIINGLVSEQVSLISVLKDTLSPTDSIVHLMTCDLPRNGYQEDTLRIINITNSGSATESDIDSLVLYLDNGNNTWEDIFIEIKIGKLSFTGDRWTRSGLSIPLTDMTTRFYLVGYMNPYPSNGATISMAIPQYGLEMSSYNDGPIDQDMPSIDTITIVTDEKISINVIPVASHELIPGEETGPLLNLQLNNLYSTNVEIDSIYFDFVGSDPDGATVSQLSSQFSAIRLYQQNDRVSEIIGDTDSLLAEAALVDGQVVFHTPGFSLEKNGGNTVLTISAVLDVQNSKNGNSVSFQLTDSVDIFTSSAVTYNAAFPLINPEDFIINSFPESAVTVHAVPGTTIFGGQVKEMLLDFELPANGYVADTLQSIRIRNIGSQSDTEAVESIDLWFDVDDNGFSDSDSKIGTFTNKDSYWELNFIQHYIPVEGKRFFITTDILNTNFSGGTIQYEILQGGCTYSSGMVGPDDYPIVNPEEHVVFPSNRITAISLPGLEENVIPGGTEKTILSFALYNGYTDRDQILTSLGLTNISKSLSASDYSDYELGSISFYYDADNSGTLNEKTPIANGRFINNKLNLSGLNITLPKEELSYFFVVSDFPVDLIDSDSLAISIEAPSDFGFEENVNINGALPLTRGSYLIVDGSSVAQYTVYPVTQKTLSPGDSDVPLFAFSPALNGDLGDRLDSMSIINTGTANDLDISQLNVWIDTNNDSLWQNTDSLISALSFNMGSWGIGDLNLEIDTVSPIIFITGDISASATPDRTIRFQLPLNSCSYLSDNDGPVDVPLSGENTFTISGSNLRVEINQLKPTYSIGETIELSLKTTNLSASTINSIYGNIVLISDSLAVVLDSSTSGPVNLTAGESYDFKFYYTAASVSSLHWQLQSVATGINDSSTVVVSPLIQIQNTPTDVPITLINSMPTAVTKGQTNVFPLSLTISHPDSLPTSAPIRLDSISLSIETASGLPQLATDVFSRIVVTAGYEILSAIETVPGLSTIPIHFDNPLIIDVNEEKSLTLLVDIDSTATAQDMVLSFNLGSDIPLVDFNNNQSLTIDPAVLFPLRTESCRIDVPSNKMEIALKPAISPNVNYGQENFDLIGFEISHPGGQSSSQIQLTSISLELLDEADNLILINEVFERIKVRKQFSIVADMFEELDSSAVQIQLTSPITLNPGERDSLFVMADINSSSTVSGFKIQVVDSTSFVVRDLSSGSLITVTADTNSLATSNLFPIVTSTATLKQVAQSPEFCFQSVLAPSVISGKDSLDLTELSIEYPYSSIYSPVVLNSILIYFLDSLESPLDPISLFDRIGYRLNGSSTIYYQSFIQLSSGAVLFSFENDSIIIHPGDSLNITITGDIEADVPYDHFRLMINESQSFTFYDETDTTFKPLVAFDEDCNQAFPLKSSISMIISPAGRPGVNSETANVMPVYAGQTDVLLYTTTIDYNQQSLQGDILLSSLQGTLQKRSYSGYSPATSSSIFENVRLLADGVSIATDSVLSTELLSLDIDSGLIIGNGETIELTLVADIKSNAQFGNYRVEFTDSTFISIEDLQLATSVYPILMSGSYPLLSQELSLSAVSLKESFSNYPNPFTDATTITFVMEENGRVDIELFTVTGKAVLKLVNDEYRSSGVYNSDVWYGKNAEGLSVVSGTYFCRISVTYDSQREESELRKISVIR